MPAQIQTWRWKVYYDDRSTYSSDDGPWESAPSDGVLFVVQWVNGQKRIMSGNDFYFMGEDGEIHETVDVGPYLRKLGVKFGRWTSHRRMEEAAAMVRADG